MIVDYRWNPFGAPMQPWTLAPQGQINLNDPRVVTPGMEAFWEYRRRGFQGLQGLGQDEATATTTTGESWVSNIFGGFSLQTLIIVGIAAFVVYKVFFSEESKAKRRRRAISEFNRKYSEDYEKRFGTKLPKSRRHKLSFA